MNIQIMQTDPRIALIHQRDYHKKVLDHRSKRMEEARKKVLEAGRDLRSARSAKSQIEKEDEQLYHAYRMMARGERIINISTVIPKAGLQAKTKLPAIAIAGASWKTCRVQDENGCIVYSQERWLNWSWKMNRFGVATVSIPRTLFPAELTNSHWRNGQSLPALANVEALVPAIPAHLRPDVLDGYYILWEPEWQHKAPVDPILLKHVNGPIYTVVAQWDLTPLEQSILETRTV